MRRLNEAVSIPCAQINPDKLHTTKLGAERIKRNLRIKTDDVVRWCGERISDKDAKTERIGKNWYVTTRDGIITVNAHSHTIITAHPVGKMNGRSCAKRRKQIKKRIIGGEK